MLEPSTTSSHFSLVLSLLGRNFPVTPFRLKIWQCSNRTLSPLIALCPGHANHYHTPCYYPSLLLTLLSFSFSSPFITNNACFFSPLPHTAGKYFIRWKALHLKPETLPTALRLLHLNLTVILIVA